MRFINRAALVNLLAALACLGLILYFSNLTGSETDLRPAIRRHPDLVERVESLPHVRYNYAGRAIDNRVDPVTFIHMGARKAGHFVLYGFFSFFLANAAAGAGLKGFRRWVAVALAVLAVALLDEYNQSHIRGRSSLVQDVGVDMAGFLAGAFFSRLFGGPLRKGRGPGWLPERPRE